MKAIVAINNHGYIGKDGTLMWRCKADLQHFKKLTGNGILIVGNTTFETCLGGKALPGRVMSVVGSNCFTLPEAVRESIELSHHTDREVWVIGGATIYNQLLPICDEVHISHINNDDVGDVKFELPENYRGKVFNYNFEEDK